MVRLARFGNVYIKLSGLSWLDDEKRCDYRRWMPSLDHLVATFGPRGALR